MEQNEFVTTGDLRIEEELNLERCHTDPIHKTAMIQPHGSFVQFDPDDMSIIACARNITDFYDVSVSEIFRLTIDQIFDGGTMSSIKDLLNRPIVRHEHLVTRTEEQNLILTFFPIGETLGLELEPFQEPSQSSTDLLFREETVFNRLRVSERKDQLFRDIAGMMKVTTEYDRVIVLEFEEGKHGHVVAESKNKGMSSYEDQYFPASDIPEPARRIYRKNNLRYIPRGQYEPVPIVDHQGQVPQNELDMTYSNLRNVPLIHRKYLNNMGVGASTSIPLMADGELWGLVTAHSSEPSFIDWHTRQLCARIGHFSSTKIERLESQEREQRLMAVDSFREQYLPDSNPRQTLFDFLEDCYADVLELLGASAFYIQFDNKAKWLTDEEETDEIPSDSVLDWIQSKLETSESIAVNSLKTEFNESWSRSKQMSGVLALRFTRRPGNFCAWFRPEQQSTIKWGGDPRNALIVDDENELNPRNSFDEWTQTIEGKCEPWQDVERLVAQDLIQIFNEVALEEQSDKLRQANAKLEAQNDELQSIKKTLEEKNQELEEVNQRLEELSYYDELTGAPNRRQFEQTLENRWEFLKRYDQPISLIMIDIDYFKEYNDRYGHQTGDNCLRKVSRALGNCVNRESDTMARYGGEEFAVILPNTSREGAVNMAQTMRKSVEELAIPHEDSENEDVLTISLGVSTCENLDRIERDELIERADDALYEAKESGRNRVAVYGE